MSFKTVCECGSDDIEHVIGGCSDIDDYGYQGYLITHCYKCHTIDCQRGASYDCEKCSYLEYCDIGKNHVEENRSPGTNEQNKLLGLFYSPFITNNIFPTKNKNEKWYPAWGGAKYDLHR